MKKIISLVALISLLSIGVVCAESGEYQNGYNAGYNDGYSDGASQVYRPKVPNIKFIQNEKIITAKAGEYVTFVIDYINDSQYTASDIKITPIFDDSILEYERPVSYEADKSLRGDKQSSASMQLKIKQSAKLGVHEVKFKVQYSNTADEVYSVTDSIFVRITEEKVKSILTIDNVIYEPEKIAAGENFVLKMNVNNIGDADASDVSIKLNGLSEKTFMAVDSKDYAYVGNIKGKSTYTQSFNINASKKIVKGDNTLGVTITYRNSEGEMISEEKSIYILDVLSQNEKVEEESTSGKPKIMIESYSTTPNNIVAGDKINFTFKFTNTSNDRTISNMKITLSSEKGAFMITKGSNTFYIEKLGPKASATRSIELNVKQDLTSDSYPVNISFDYEDNELNTYTSNEVINLPVTEYSKLVINSANVFECMVGSQTSLSFDYINMGRARISNLTASVEGDFTSVQSINYIGNLEAGNSDYYDIMVTPNKEGELVGTLVLSFEDSSGKIIEERKEFTSFAMPAYNPNQDTGFEGPIDVMPMETEEEGMPWWQIALYGLGSFAITFIITKVITTKIIRKKLEEEI